MRRLIFRAVKFINRVLIIVLVVLLLLDFLLYHFDPTGVVRYIHDEATISRYMQDAPDGYHYLPGTYHLNTFTFTAGVDGFREVQSAKTSDCWVVFAGDSVTFGWGSSVNFVDLLASDLPAAVTNGGVPGYSALNVAAELATIPAQGYVWLIINNDDYPFVQWYRVTAPRYDSATAIYLTHLFPPEQPPVNEPEFVERLTPILSRDDVLAFIFEGQRLTDIVQRVFPQVHVIPMYTSRVSVYDGHPNAQSHAEIADAMRDDVVAFVQQRCLR